MTHYRAPLREHRFIRERVLGLDRFAQEPVFAEATPDIFDAVLDEAARFAEQILSPLSRPGDEAGCSFVAGEVTTPPGYRDAFDQFVQGGWPGLSARPEHGGQGLPHILYVAVDEFITAACNGFAMYRGLIDGAYNAILHHGDPALQDRFLEPLATGALLPTMNLTEPHCGSDLGLLKTRATPLGDGRFALTGTKIFITGGEHDLTRNILHLVLARLPDAPAGSQGISLFVVPKFLVGESGEEIRNGVQCTGIEHKMGLWASATCSMSYEDAVGWLVGPPHGGLRAMFTMMNAARLAVGLQGIAAGDATLQIASDYAAERRQGKAPLDSGEGASPIILHPDVERMIRTQKAWIEGGRTLALRMALALDLASGAQDAATREYEDDIAQILTPIVKSFLSEAGFESANLAMQVMGGHGYIRESGVEQWVRDVRIAAIYEGTNSIQALDLVGRKLAMRDGRLAERYLAEIERDLRAARQILPGAAQGLDALVALRKTTARLGAADATQVASVATEYQKFFGYVALAGTWARIAAAAASMLDEDEGYAGDKLATAAFYFDRMLPAWLALRQSIHSVIDRKIPA